MINSMTGFGEACGQADGIAYAVEIKTVNNRYLKTTVRMSDTVSFCEEDVEKLIRRKLHRGTVNCSVKLGHVAGPTLYDVDKMVVSNYIESLKAVAEESGVDYEINLAELLTLPGAVFAVNPDEETAAKMKEVVLGLTAEALDKLREAREKEGVCIVADLVNHCGIIREKLSGVKKRAPVVIEQYYEKLKKRVDELTGSAQLAIDPDTMAREVALYAEKCDIAEELSRLDAHLDQFEKCCNGAEAAGRRLDFIGQEMLREANTIASKSSDSEIAALVIDIKCAIDRIKEQVQNIE